MAVLWLANQIFRSYRSTAVPNKMIRKFTSCQRLGNHSRLDKTLGWKCHRKIVLPSSRIKLIHTTKNCNVSIFLCYKPWAKTLFLSIFTEPRMILAQQTELSKLKHSTWDSRSESQDGANHCNGPDPWDRSAPKNVSCHSGCVSLL